MAWVQILGGVAAVFTATTAMLGAVTFLLRALTTPYRDHIKDLRESNKALRQQRDQAIKLARQSNATSKKATDIVASQNERRREFAK